MRIQMVIKGHNFLQSLVYFLAGCMVVLISAPVDVVIYHMDVNSVDTYIVSAIYLVKHDKPIIVE